MVYTAILLIKDLLINGKRPRTVTSFAYRRRPPDPLDDALAEAPNIDRLYLLPFTETQRVLRELLAPKLNQAV